MHADMFRVFRSARVLCTPWLLRRLQLTDLYLFSLLSSSLGYLAAKPAGLPGLVHCFKWQRNRLWHVHSVVYFVHPLCFPVLVSANLQGFQASNMSWVGGWMNGCVCFEHLFKQELACEIVLRNLESTPVFVCWATYGGERFIQMWSFGPCLLEFQVCVNKFTR